MKIIPGVALWASLGSAPLLLGGWLLAAPPPGRASEMERDVLTSEGLQGLLPLESAEASLVWQDDMIAVCFSALIGKATQIYWTVSSGRETHWAAPLAVASSENGSRRPVLWRDSAGVLHCAWLSYGKKRRAEVLYSRLPVGGTEWTPPRHLNAGHWKTSPGLIGDTRGRLYLYYSASHGTRSPGEISLHVSEDGGLNWRESDPNFPPGERRAKPSDPILANDGDGQVFLVWLDAAPGGKAIVFNTSADGGRSWLERPHTLNENITWRLSSPNLFSVKKRLFVTWTKPLLTGSGKRVEIWFDSSDDQGRSWQGNQRVVSAKASALDTAVYSRGKTVYVLWMERGGVGPSRIVERQIWPSGHTTETVISQVPEGWKNEDLALVSQEEKTVIVWTSHPRAGAERVLLAARSHGAWNQLPVGLAPPGIRQLHPVPVLSPLSGDCLILFHEVRMRRFPFENPVFGTRLVTVRVPSAALEASSLSQGGGLLQSERAPGPD